MPSRGAWSSSCCSPLRNDRSFAHRPFVGEPLELDVGGLPSRAPPSSARTLSSSSSFALSSSSCRLAYSTAGVSSSGTDALISALRRAVRALRRANSASATAELA